MIKKHSISMIIILVLTCACDRSDRSDITKKENIESQKQEKHVYNKVSPLNNGGIDDHHIYLNCKPKFETHYNLDYRVTDYQDELTITAFDASTNSYIEDDILFFSDRDDDFDWLSNIDSLGIFYLSYEKDDDYYYSYKNLKTESKSDNPEYSALLYRTLIFKINRKTGNMSSPSFNVATCINSANRINIQNRF